MSPRRTEVNEKMREEALEKIAKAALVAFAHYGYHGTTIKQIAAGTGLSYGLVYHYFPSKADVFIYLVDFALDSTIQALRGIHALPGNAWDKLRAYSSSVAANAFSGENSLYFLVMTQAMTQSKAIPGMSERLAPRFKEYFDILVPVVVNAQAEGAVKGGDPMMLSAVYFSLIQGLALLQFQGLGLESRITADTLLSVLVKGGE